MPSTEATRKLISLIIPAYNAGNTIMNCIKSIGHHDDCQIIVIDDGSNDNTAKLMRTLKQVKYIYQENQGVSAARNTGLQASDGEYIMFVDADDTLTSNWFSLVKQELINSKEADIIIFTQQYSEDGNEYADAYQCFDRCTSYDYSMDGLTKYIVSSPVSKLYKNDFLNEHDLSFNTNIRTGEDLIFNAQAYSCNPTIKINNHGIYEYHKTMQSSTNSIDTHALDNERYYHQALSEIVKHSKIRKYRKTEIIRQNCLGGLLNVMLHANDREYALKCITALITDGGAQNQYVYALNDIKDAKMYQSSFGKYKYAILKAIANGHYDKAYDMIVLFKKLKQWKYSRHSDTIIEKL